MVTEHLRVECGGSLIGIKLYKRHLWPAVLEDEQSLF